MRRATVWVIGVVGIAALWGAAVAYKARPIERSIAAAAANEFNRRGLQRRFESLALDVDGRDIRVIGTALSETDQRDALDAASSVPGVGRVINEIQLAKALKPYVFRVLRKADGSTLLTGGVPVPETMARITQLGRSVFGAQLGLSLQLARGVPEGDWYAAAKAAVEVMALVSQGEATLSDKRLTVSGRVSDDSALESVASMLKRSMPAGYTAVSTLATPLDSALDGPALHDAKACQALVDRVVGHRDFRFEPGSTALQEAPHRLLERLAAVMKRCGGLYLEIYAAGDAHTGSPAADLRLSEARARVLLDALVERGVARERMMAVGRGHLSPVERAAGPDVKFRVNADSIPLVRPFAWRIEKDSAGDGAILGHYPSEEARDALAAAARKVLHGKLADGSRPGQGAPSGDWLSAARLAVSLLGQIESGTVSLVDYEIVVHGVAGDDDAVKLIEAGAAERAPTGFHIKFELGTRLDERLGGPEIASASECQSLLDTVARTRDVEFVVDGAALLDRQTLLFRRLAAAMHRCRRFKLEIGGHAAGTGDPEAARVLSEHWAQAVADALVKAGTPADRLRAVGYGNTKPVADPGTDDGRERNRRITFRVIP
jgi:OOP family OmpA-OmpF porin